MGKAPVDVLTYNHVREVLSQEGISAESLDTADKIREGVGFMKAEAERLERLSQSLMAELDDADALVAER